MEKIDINTKIIGKCGNLLMLSNDSTASLDGFEQIAFVVEADTGKRITGDYTIDFLLRTEEDLEWIPSNDFYFDVYSDRAFQDISLDGLIGFDTGDALGVPVEFLDKESVRKINVQEMMGNDTNLPFKSRWSKLIPSGAWSDDTSMIYATMDSIVNRRKIDYNDIMNSYLKWLRYGKYSSLDFAFGLGRTVDEALERYRRGMTPIECGGKGIRDNGNGALMRILPFSLYSIEAELSEEETVKLISSGSSITHGHEISKMSCFIYTEFMKELLNTKNPKMAFARILSIDYSKYFSMEAIDAHKKLLNSNFISLPDEKINGSGYVVDSLECALYSILNTDNYEDAVKMAINTGYDTDTIGGITGSLAGILYGEKNIPEKWKNKLLKKDELNLIALKYRAFLDLLKKNELDEIMDNNSDLMNFDSYIKL